MRVLHLNFSILNNRDGVCDAHVADAPNSSTYSIKVSHEFDLHAVHEHSIRSFNILEEARRSIFVNAANPQLANYDAAYPQLQLLHRAGEDLARQLLGDAVLAGMARGIDAIEIKYPAHSPLLHALAYELTVVDGEFLGFGFPVSRVHSDRPAGPFRSPRRLIYSQIVNVDVDPPDGAVFSHWQDSGIFAADSTVAMSQVLGGSDVVVVFAHGSHNLNNSDHHGIVLKRSPPDILYGQDLAKLLLSVPRTSLPRLMIVMVCDRIIETRGPNGPLATAALNSGVGHYIGATIDISQPDSVRLVEELCREFRDPIPVSAALYRARRKLRNFPDQWCDGRSVIGLSIIDFGKVDQGLSPSADFRRPLPQTPIVPLANPKGQTDSVFVYRADSLPDSVRDPSAFLTLKVVGESQSSKTYFIRERIPELDFDVRGSAGGSPWQLHIQANAAVIDPQKVVRCLSSQSSSISIWQLQDALSGIAQQCLERRISQLIKVYGTVESILGEDAITSPSLTHLLREYNRTGIDLTVTSFRFGSPQ